MIKLFITLHLLALRLAAPINHRLDQAHTTLRRARDKDERGSLTLEQVIWAAVLIGLALAVVAAITAYVNKEKSKIQ